VQQLEKTVRPFPLKSKLFPEVVQPNRRVLAGKRSQEGQEMGIVLEQFNLDFEVAELRNGERRSVGRRARQAWSRRPTP
jgi:hypothetical protein